MDPSTRWTAASRKQPQVLSWVAIATLVTAFYFLLPSVSLAGRNAGATATMSWDVNAAVQNESGISGWPLHLYVTLNGYSDLRGVAVEVQWYPCGADSGFMFVPDSALAENCASAIGVVPGSSFQGDSTFSSEFVYSGATPPPQMRFAFIPIGGAPPIAQFCATQVFLLDAQGQVDPVPVTNCATIGGGLPDGCPPSMYAATQPNTANEDTSIIDIFGNGLAAASVQIGPQSGDQSQQFVASARQPKMRTSAGPSSQTATPSSWTDHLRAINVAGAGITSGSWTLIASNGSGADTLTMTAPDQQSAHARFVPFVSLDASWTLPSGTSPCWSPDGRYLLLMHDGGLWAIDMASDARNPMRILNQTVSDYIWGPCGDALVCRTQTDEERHLGLCTLVVVDPGQPVGPPLLTRCDAQFLAWPTADTVYAWDRTVASPRPIAVTGFSCAGSPSQVRTMPLFTIPDHGGATLVVRSATSEQGTSGLRAVTQGVAADGPFNVVGPLGTTGNVVANVFPAHSRPYAAELDSTSRVILNLGDAVGTPAFVAASITPDQHYILGTVPVSDQSATTHPGLAPRVLDIDTSRLLEVDGITGGRNPRCSPVSFLVAYEASSGGGVYAGLLVLSAR